MLDFTEIPASHRARWVAGGVAALLVGVALAAYPGARTLWPRVVASQAVFATSVLVTEALTALFLWLQYRAGGQTFLGVLAGGYGFSAAISLLQLLIFPQVLSPDGFFGAGAQSAVWLWTVWHAGLPLFVLAAVLVYLTRATPVSRTVEPYLVLGVPPLLAVVAFLVVLHDRNWLPVVTQGDDFATLSQGAVGKSVLALAFTAAAGAAWAGRFRTLIWIWVPITALSNALDAVLCLAGEKRFSQGWYVSRGLSLATSLFLLGVAILTISELYAEFGQANQKLRELANRDALTGLRNRRSFDRRGSRLLAVQRNAEFTLLLLDIDHFKRINDDFGHPVGDRALQAVSQILQRSLRGELDMAARYGGEEFAVLLPGAGLTEGRAIAERIRQEVEKMSVAGLDRHMTISIGLAKAPENGGASVEDLVREADQALYRAKSLGRNRAEVAEADVTTASVTPDRVAQNVHARLGAVTGSRKGGGARKKGFIETDVL